MNKRAPQPPAQLSAYERAVALHQQGKLEEAKAAYQKILAKTHNHSGTLNNLGLIEKNQGNYNEAMTFYDRALQYNPNHVDALVNKGNILQMRGQYAESMPLLKKAVELNPKNVAAKVTLSWGYIMCSMNVAASNILEEARALAPNHPVVLQNLGTAYYRQGLLDKALETNQYSYHHFNAPVVHSNLLFTMHFSPRFNMKALYDLALDWDKKHAQAIMPPRASWPKKEGGAGKRLRVGFVSGDFRMHPVSYFFASMLEARTPEDNWDPILYADVLNADAMTERLSASSLKLTNIAGMSDDALAASICADSIDILFDLTGHTGKNRLLTFARKPAPIQATWIGYFDTTGMEVMDYLLADPITIPHEMQPYYREKIMHMPNDFLCYEPPKKSPDIASLPALENGYITFGSANQITKITDEVIALWVSVVTTVPNAKLVIKTKALGDKEVQERYHTLFEKAGLAKDKLMLEGPGTQQEMLAFYNRIDIALDPFPCAGGTTTCEALWMGVPVITLMGERFCNRHSASHIKNAGIDDTIAQTTQEYLDIAKRLSSDITSLSKRRVNMRSLIAASPLCDAPRFAKDFAQVLRAMWVRE